MASATESQPAGRATGAGEPLLVFVHVPKAAGTSLGRILRCHYGDAFERIDQVRRRELSDAAERGERDPSRAAAPGLRAVSGHLPFGLARFFPDDALYVTVLRDPVQRTLSQYEYLLTRVGRPWEHDLLPPPTRGLTVAQALGEGYVRDNLQTRLLCGVASIHSELPADALEQAKRNLSERFAYVGTTERFAESLALLNLGLGWPTVAYKEGRVTPGRRPSAERPAGELRLVEEANLLDRELYAHAEGLLADAVAAAGPALQEEAEVLRRALPLERRAFRGEEVLDPAEVRALPLEARVALALREAELGRVREEARGRSRKVELLKDRVRRREERVAELKQLLLDALGRRGS
jgi:hypothetical protein